MYNEAKKAREAMKNKAKRLASANSDKVDSSTWTQAEPLDADVKTGMRPVSRRAFKAGGKVEGEATKKNAGRTPRANGGKAKSYANALVNRNAKDANEEREGKKHIGGMKSGGRAKKLSGGALDALSVLSPAALAYNMIKGKDDKDEKKRGGRAKREEGGKVPLPPEMPESIRKIREANDTSKPMEAKDHYSKENLKRLEAGRKSGGRAKKNDGGPMGDPRLGIVKGKMMEFNGNPVTPGMKKGGKAEKHSDEAMDKALIKKMVKPSARTEKASGGSTKYLGAGRGKEKEDAEKEFGPREEAMDRASRQIENEFSPAAMRKMRADIAARRAGNKDLQAFAARRKKQLDDESMEKSGYKKGGRTKRATGGMIEDTKKALMLKSDPHNQSKIKPAEPKKEAAEAKACGGRMARKSGGRAKGKTNINIVISGAGGAGGPPAGMMPPGGPMGGPPGGGRPPAGVPVPMPAPQGGAPMPMPVPMPAPQGGGMPPMPRKAGGRVTKVAKSYKDMEAGAGSGEGRLQKTDIAKRTNKGKKEDGEKTFSGAGYPNKVPGATGGRTARKAGGKIYRSYKDMDAGAGSGEGRLEKTEIAKHKK